MYIKILFHDMHIRVNGGTEYKIILISLRHIKAGGFHCRRGTVPFGLVCNIGFSVALAVPRLSKGSILTNKCPPSPQEERLSSFPLQQPLMCVCLMALLGPVICDGRSSAPHKSQRLDSHYC